MEQIHKWLNNIGDIMLSIRRWLDSLFMSDLNWKKKYCPNFYRYVTDPDFAHECLIKFKESSINGSK